MAKKGIVLLSGGLDSALNLALAKDKIELALTFDYGQRAAEREKAAAKELAAYYNIKHKIYKLDFLEGISGGALLGQGEIPKYTRNQLENDYAYQHETAKKVWVPNRNGLFINIAASLAEGMGLTEIYVGFNAEEAQTFPDNTAQFIDAINKSLSYSTLSKVQVISETINMTKEEMMKKAIQVGMPLNKIWSCYLGGEKQCGICESCMRLKRAYQSVTGGEYAY